VRLFFAIELPAEVRAALARVRETPALDPRTFRAAGEDTLHLTVRFVGEVDDARVPLLVTAGERAAAGVPPVPCEVAGLGSFPHGSRARVVWAGIADRSEAHELERLARRLEDEIRGAGFPAEERPFAPHVTLARARERRSGGLRLPAPSGPIASFAARELTLFRSRLGAGGARHDALATFPFLAVPR